MTLVELLDKLERGHIGHTQAMEWLGIDSYRELVEIVHFNGRHMPGHKVKRVPPKTLSLLRQITRPIHTHSVSAR